MDTRLTKRQKIKLHKRIREKKGKANRRIQIGSGLFLAPSLLGVLLFFVAPFLVVIYYAFVDNPISGNFVFFENFGIILQNNAFKKAIANTAHFSVIAVPLAVILSLMLAIVLESKMPFRTQFRTFFLSPMMVPVASIVLIWQVLFQYNGAVNDLLSVFGIGKIDWLKSEYSQVIIVLLFLWKNLGYNMILFMAALASIPKDILEVARLESANKFQTFFYIKIRYLSATILFVTIMSLISSFKVFRAVYLLTGDYPFDTIYMLQHFMNNKFRSLDYQMPSAAAIMMSIVMVFIIGALFWVENRFGRDIEGEFDGKQFEIAEETSGQQNISSRQAQKNKCKDTNWNCNGYRSVFCHIIFIADRAYDHQFFHGVFRNFGQLRFGV